MCLGICGGLCLGCKASCLFNAQEAGFQLELSIEMTYEEVEAAVALHLGLADQRKLRFTAHNNYSQACPHRSITAHPDTNAPP